jgi:hypothetical protein
MEKFVQVCDATGKGMNAGYVVNDGEMYFSEEKYLVDYLRTLNWEDCNGNLSSDIDNDNDNDLLEFFYNDDMYYYTEWDEEINENNYDCYYDADGNEYEF